MKARLLKKKLNDTGYIVHGKPDCICVGSPMCADLISVDKKTMKRKYALDTFNEGRSSLRNEELKQIWDTLGELIASGEIYDIIEGVDEIENPLPVFTYTDTEIISTTTDAYGWPNVTVSGELMYESEFFKTRQEAVEKAIQDCSYFIESDERLLSGKEKEVREVKDRIIRARVAVLDFISMREIKQP